VAFQQGFFTVARTCGRCRGSGRVIATPCAECRGEGAVARERKLQIKIPGGVDTGSQLRMTGEGEAGAQGGPPGDLYVVVRVAEHPFFHRDGTSLLCEVPVSFTQAALGTTIEVPTPDGGRAKVQIPEGTQTGHSFRVRGHGVPQLGGRGRGDLHVAVRVVVPTRLNAEQRKLLEQLGRTLSVPDAGKDKDKSFFEKVKDLLG
jgi:molecular chaperone DnaJ